MKTLKQLLGNRVIKETVYRDSAGRKKGTTFTCMCPNDCGNTVSIDKRSRTNTTCVSCAAKVSMNNKHLHKKLNWTTVSHDIKSITNPKVLNKKDILLRVEKTKDSTHTRYVFQCRKDMGDGNICGNEFKHLDADTCKSCSQKLKPYERTYNRLKVKHNKRWNTSIMEYKEFFNICLNQLDCHYCEKPLPKRAVFNNKPGSHAFFIDRKDNDSGYTKENSVPCCSVCNTTKGANLTYDEMILIMNYRKA